MASMRRIDDDTYELTSGRRVSARGGIIGLASDYVLGLGADDGLDMDDDLEPWSLDEKREMADFMIALWTRWRDRQPEARA